MSHPFTNHLVNESSLYLRQHAHNPVEWYPWGEEALNKAKAEDKPVLISIGYAACHWCHVMERESFEDEQVAAFMNLHFINIKIDREERPDLDHIYMDAVQAMTGSGGWPLNVFCTPDTRPFFGGTYFPPRAAYNRISWMELLQRIRQAWENKRDGLEEQAGRILEHISTTGRLQAVAGVEFNQDACRQMAVAILEASDKIRGGFGSAPKFPHTLTIRYLLEYSCQYKDAGAGKQAELSLKKMIRGGIYDHLGGGLARYSTDDQWLVPHFEKMLYDNALLLSALAPAYMLTGDEEYAACMRKTFSFLKDEMRDPSGGYYSAIDADSEGEEGKFYVWDRKEIDDLLGEYAGIYCDWFGVKEEGNWEGSNILHIHSDLNSFAGQHGLSVIDFQKLIEECNSQLLKRRSRRIRPQTDDKILTGWNALLVSGLCRAFSATGEEAYRDEAVSLADFIFNNLKREDEWYHCFHQGTIKHPAFLDDIACLAEACILLQEITGHQHYLEKANGLMKWADKYFLLPSGFYSYTNSNMNDLLFRKTEYYDGAMPSGNSTMAFNLFYLGRILDKPAYCERSEKMLAGIIHPILKYPVSFSLWSSVLMYKLIKNKEIVIVGADSEAIRKKMLRKLIPGRIFQSSETQQDLPLIQGKNFSEKPLIYLCINSLCLSPFDSFAAFEQALAGSES